MGVLGGSPVSVFKKTKKYEWHYQCSSFLLPYPFTHHCYPHSHRPPISPLSASPVRQLWQHQHEVRTGLVSDQPEPGFHPIVCSPERGVWKGLAAQGEHLPRAAQGLGVPRAVTFPLLTEAAGVGAGGVEALHPTSLAEGMLRLVSVERVCGYALRSLRENRQTGVAFHKEMLFLP